MADLQLLITRASGAIELATRADDGWARRELAASGRWPTWNARAGLVAFSRVDARRGEVRSTIELARLDGSEAGTAHITPQGVPPVIAPRVPHYLMWEPTGEVLSFVAPAPRGLTLFLSDPGGAYSSDPIVTAAPTFSSWSPDGRWLAVHAGTELLVYEPASRGKRVVSERALGFRTPAIVGNYVYSCRPAGEGAEVVGFGLAGYSEERSLLPLPGGAALSPRPGSSDLSIATTAEPDSGMFDMLYLADTAAATPERRFVARGPFVGAWWSPDGAMVALVVPTQIGDGRYALRILDADGAPVCASEGFYPAQDYRTMLAFFDQYSHSHPAWAPDSSHFLAVGRLATDGRASSFSDPIEDQVYLLPAEPGQPLAWVGPGENASFVGP